MYVYFDKNGVIREIINDAGIRRGSSNVNSVYIYIDTDIVFSGITWDLKKSDGTTTITHELDPSTDIVYEEIPYDKNRDLTYFKDYKTYKFYKITFTAQELNVAGLALLTVRFYTSQSEIYTAGLITFNIENSVINEDNEITVSQYEYLLSIINGYLRGATLDGVDIVEDGVAKILSSSIELNSSQVSDVLGNTETIGISISGGKIYFSVTSTVLDRIAALETAVGTINDTTIPALDNRIDDLESDNTTNKGNITSLQNNKLNKDFSGLSTANELADNDLFVIKNSLGQTLVIPADLVKEASEHYLGNYASANDLETAHPTANAGDYAYVLIENPSDENDTVLIMYIWDDEDGEWQQTASTNYVSTSAFNAFQTSLQDGTFPVGKADQIKYGNSYEDIENVITSETTNQITENSTSPVSSGAVYTGLAGKQDTLQSGVDIKTINSTSLLGSGDIDTKELFICTYNSTTTSQVTSAINNGKLPIFTYGGNVYVLANNNSSVYTFTNVKGSIVNEITLNTDVWSAVTTYSLQPSALVTNFTDADNSHYPSAKLVNDTLATKQDALSNTQLSAVNSGIDSTKVGQITTNATNISTIQGVIPSAATTSNQLADKNFVNSSIATNTAKFIGTFVDVESLNAYDDTPITNNDYANVTNSQHDFNDTTEMNNYEKYLLTNYDYGWVVNGAKYDLYRFDIQTQTWSQRATNISKGDVALITAYNRYTYTSATSEWVWNYTVNTSGFTAQQWAAVNSGITSTLVGKITTNENNITSLQSDKLDKTAYATTSAYGLIKLGSSTQAGTMETASSTSGRYYPLQVNANGQASVNVPWTDTVYTPDFDTNANVIDLVDDIFVSYTITTSVTNGTYSGSETIDKLGTASVTIIPDSDYDLPSSVTVSGATSSYNSTTGVITLSNATGNVTISAVCESASVSYNVTITADGVWANSEIGVITIYDGQDTTGTELLNQSPANKSAFPMTLQVSSGYCFVKCDGGVIIGVGVSSNDYSQSGTKWRRICLIDKNGSININVDNWDD